MSNQQTPSAVHEPTIAAIATPPGSGGIGIIRISGPSALEILEKLFIPKKHPGKFHSHQMYYGWLRKPETDQLLDEILAVYMQAPHTYTREDVVELHCHGSFLILQEILGLVQTAGARLAEPGEFTKCAFLNGRIDLTQAEAVLELLSAQTSTGLHLALNQLQGGLHDTIEKIRDSLVSIKAIIEVAIDFPDDDIDIINPHDLTLRLSKNIMPVLENLISAADNGKIFREGIAVVIIGRPNVGKSSLLNALLREERAIVTPLPGTTRDTIEEYLNIRGLPVRIVDTAGIRHAAGTIEEIGIQRSKEKLAQADLVLLMLDSSVPLHSEDIELFNNASEKPLVIAANKSDICLPQAEDTYNKHFINHQITAISAKHGKGIGILEEKIFQKVTGKDAGWDPGHSTVPNLRQQAAISNALAACRRLHDGLHHLPPDLLAVELQSSLDYLGDIVGYTTTEDVLDKIFGEFCLGK